MNDTVNKQKTKLCTKEYDNNRKQKVAKKAMCEIDVFSFDQCDL